MEGELASLASSSLPCKLPPHTPRCCECVCTHTVITDSPVLRDGRAGEKKQVEGFCLARAERANLSLAGRMAVR